MRKEILFLAFLFFVSLFIRAVVYIQLSDYFLFKVPFPSSDGDFYVFIGKFLNEDLPFVSKEVFYFSPLFGYLVAFFQKVFGDTTVSVKIFNILIGSTIPIAVYLSGKVFFKERFIPVILSFISAFLDILIIYDVHPLKTTLGIFFLVWGFYFFLFYRESKKNFILFLSGLFLSLGSLIYANFMLVLLFLFIYTVFQYRQKAVLFVLPVVLVIGSTALRNYVVKNDVVPVTAIGGIHFYIGNSKFASGMYHKIPGVRASGFGHYFDGREIAQKQLKKKLKPSEVSSFWKEKALKEIKENKERFFKLLLKKLLYTINYFDIPNNINKNFYKERVFSLKFFTVSIGVILLFGLAGFFLSLRKKDFLPVHIFFVVYVLTVVMFFVTDRYRLPIFFPLLLYTGYFMRYFFEANLLKKGLAFLLLLLISFPVFYKTPLSKKDFSAVTVRHELISHDLFKINQQIRKEKDRRKLSVLYMKKASIYSRNKSYEQAFYLLSKAVRLNNKNKMAKSMLGKIKEKIPYYKEYENE